MTFDICSVKLSLGWRMTDIANDEKLTLIDLGHVINDQQAEVW
jgi:predicted metal-dependent RNase